MNADITNENVSAVATKEAEFPARMEEAIIRVLRHRYVLASILADVIPEFQGLDPLDIADRNLGGLFVLEEGGRDPCLREVAQRCPEIFTQEGDRITAPHSMTATLERNGKVYPFVFDLVVVKEYSPDEPYSRVAEVMSNCLYLAANRKNELQDFAGTATGTYTILLVLDVPEDMGNAVGVTQTIGERIFPDPGPVDTSAVRMPHSAVLLLGNPELTREKGAMRLLDTLFSRELSFQAKREMIQEEYPCVFGRAFWEDVALITQMRQGAGKVGETN